MKVKYDFVTNSSTTSYIFVVPFKKFDADTIRSFDYSGNVLEDITYFEKMENIIGWVQDSPVDWVNPIMGPRQYVNLSKESYDKVVSSWKEVEKTKDTLTLVKVDWERSRTNSDSFRNSLEKYIEKNFGYIVDMESW